VAVPAQTAAAANASQIARENVVETKLTATGSVYVHETGSLYMPRTPPPKPPPSLLLWSTFSLLLLLILSVQALHFWRNDLATRSDWVGQSMTRIYDMMALPLAPNWDLQGYNVRQLGAATNGGADSALRVRISLTNRAQREQPYPVLRLTLLDRFSHRVAARDLQPHEYLHGGRAEAESMMPIGKEIESEVAVEDPGPNASSFELDVCIVSQHGLRCAADAPLLTAARS
jgi:hypothetical protein